MSQVHSKKHKSLVLDDQKLLTISQEVVLIQSHQLEDHLGHLHCKRACIDYE